MQELVPGAWNDSPTNGMKANILIVWSLESGVFNLSLAVKVTAYASAMMSLNMVFDDCKPLSTLGARMCVCVGMCGPCQWPQSFDY